MGDIQFNGTPEEWNALVKKNKIKEAVLTKWDRLNKELEDALDAAFGSEPKQETLEEVEKNIDREEWINFFKNNSKEEILEYLINYKFPL
jgi:hypothetical protein